MKRYRTVDYKMLNQIIKDEHIHYNKKLPMKQLGEYILKKHPHLFTQSLTKPLDLASVMKMAILWFVPELRPHYHVALKVIAKLMPKPHVRYNITFYRANQHSKSYWNNFLDDVCKCRQIPIFRETWLWHNLIPREFQFYTTFFNQEPPLVNIYFVNSLEKGTLRQTQSFLYNVTNIRYNTLRCNLYDLLQQHKLKRVATDWNNYISMYQIGKQKICIQSQELNQLVYNQEFRAKHDKNKKQKHQSVKSKVNKK